MKNRHLNLRHAFIGVMAVWVGAFTAYGQNADTSPAAKNATRNTKAVLVPDEATSEVNSNAPQTGIKKDGLKQVEDDLFKPLKKQFSLKSSLDAVFVPPQPRLRRDPVPQTKKEKEEEAEKREWVFLSPEEVASGPSIEEIFNVPEYGPDGLEKKKLSPMERYIEKMDKNGNGETNSNAQARDSKGYTAANQSRAKEDAELVERSKHPKKVEESSFERMQKLFSANSENTSRIGASRGTVSDIFGTGDNKPSPEWTKGQKDRMDEFKQLSGFSSPSSATTLGFDPFASAKGLSDPVAKTASPFAGMDAATAPKSSSADPGWMKINPVSVPDFGSSKGFGGPAFGGSSGFNPAPLRQDTFNLAPPSPTFTAPKRPF